MPKKTIVEVVEETPTDLTGADITDELQKTEKEKLLELYQVMQDLGIRSISDLENKIARL